MLIYSFFGVFVKSFVTCPKEFIQAGKLGLTFRIRQLQAGPPRTDNLGFTHFSSPIIA